MTGDKNQGNGRKGVVAVDKDESVVHTYSTVVDKF